MATTSASGSRPVGTSSNPSPVTSANAGQRTASTSKPRPRPTTGERLRSVVTCIASFRSPGFGGTRSRTPRICASRRRLAATDWLYASAVERSRCQNGARLAIEASSSFSRNRSALATSVEAISPSTVSRAVPGKTSGSTAPTPLTRKTQPIPRQWIRETIQVGKLTADELLQRCGWEMPEPLPTDRNRDPMRASSGKHGL